MSFAIILSVFALILFIYNQFFRKRQNIPPGPWAVPVLGNLIQMGRKPYVAFEKWGNKYGSIFSVIFGPQLTIVLNDPALIREAFNNPLLSGRPDNKAFNIQTGGKHGVINSDGEQWLEQRRFTLRTLRDFGFGRQTMDTLISEEVKEIIEWMKSNEGQPVSVNRKFGLSVLNSLWMIITGHRFNHDDPKLTRIMDQTMETFNELMKSGGVVFFLPDLSEKFPNISGWNKMLRSLAPLMQFFEDAVKDHETNPPADETQPRDFIDEYFNEIKKTTNPNSSFYKEAGRKSLVAVVSDLHGAGSETTSTTLTWTLLFLSLHPKVQQKLQKEIDEVIGKNRIPCLADKTKMPYMEAVTMEVLRKSTLVPTGVPHTAMADVEFHGYTIPKGSFIMTNNFGLHHSPKIWGDPHVFRPERFLSPDEKTVTRNDALLPFSIGRRICLGEALARDVLFLFIAGIFQRFEVKLNPEEPEPTMEPEVGVLLAPKPFTVIMKDRLIA